MKKKKFSVMWECMIALGIGMNVIGAFLAMNLRLPVYLDSIGTAVTAAFLGPAAGAVTGILGSICSGFIFDIYSFYYAPAQIITGLTAGWLFGTGWLAAKGSASSSIFKKRRLLAGAFAVSVPTSIASAVVTAFVFGGITSSGSTYIVMLLQKLGLNLTLSCFLVQVLTDYGDELIALSAAAVAVAVAGTQLRSKIRGDINGQV